MLGAKIASVPSKYGPVLLELFMTCFLIDVSLIRPSSGSLTGIFIDTRNFECLIVSSCLFLSVSMNLMIFVLICFEEGIQKKGFSSNTFICGERNNYDKYTESLASFFHTNATPNTGSSYISHASNK